MKCPKCGSMIDYNVNFCENCGFDLREINEAYKLLENDPVLSRLNNRYYIVGGVKLFSGIIAFVSLILMYSALKYNLPDIVGILGMIFILPSFVIFIISCIIRGIQKRKIEKELKKHNLNNF